MICFPNAKINIGLNILRKRKDGYHDIETVMYPLKGILYDALEIIQGSGEEVKIKATGIKIPGNENENLCVKAYNLIKKDYSLPAVKIYLHKAIPMGAGLGGGSADAAFFIKLLNETFELGISWGEMHNYARLLGSDCSFFISNQPAFAEGRGEKLETIREIKALEGKYIALIYPNVHVSTIEAYALVKPKQPKTSLEELISLPLAKWKSNIHNDFEDFIFPKYPELKKIKEKLYSSGAVYASMSGSGSALYGIFKTKPNAKKKFGKYSVWEGKIP